jgi:hypothetical protein
MWNYWLGGKDHFAADRAAADRVTEGIPLMPVIARATRRFTAGTVRGLAARGVRQFLDIGTGLPVAEPTHELAQQAIEAATGGGTARDLRVVYVDNDPLVASHARALLVGREAGVTDYAQMDLRDAGEMLARAAETLDFRQPVAVLLAAVVHFVPDVDDPWAIMTRLRGALAPGSALLVTHAASDIQPDGVAAAIGCYNERALVPLTPRSHGQVSRFFDGMRLDGQGVLPAGRWLDPDAPGDGGMPAYFAVARPA